MFVLARVAENWGARSRLRAAAGAFIATVPVWPVIQPNEPIADEMLAPAEVAVLVPVVLVFPIAWALLGRFRRSSRSVARWLAMLVLAWSLWTVNFGEYGTPPTVDDDLRAYLVTAAVVVVAGVLIERQAPRPHPRSVAGAVSWVLGVAVIFTVPVLDDVPTPPEAVFLPLTPVTALLSYQSTCHKVGWLANPYELCANFRVVDNRRMEVRFGYANEHDPIY